MAVRNGSAYLGEALDSILAQGFGDFELLIVDDASDDETPGILTAYQARDSRIRVWRNDRALGPYPSANRALEQARGRFVARHDGDDISPPDRFAIQIEPLRAGPGVSLVLGIVEVFDGARRVFARFSPPSWQPRLEWDLLFSNPIGAGGHPMFPRIVDGAAVRFPAAHPYAEDYGLWCRLARAGRVVCPQEVVYRYRRHAASITSRDGRTQLACMSAIRAAYQSLYLRHPIDVELSAELTRFWLMEAGGDPIGPDRACPALMELRSTFLDYIRQRYGRGDAERLRVDTDTEMDERIGYWILRALRSFDPGGVRRLLSIARGRGRVRQACRQAARRAAGRLTRQRA
jgi:glycosyltransferase involved in cell wall biosynthesis